ncbi:MAG: adenylate/guanylate cyclase domain-containing protein [Armatimonadetes bacterium]|nr:adenylate/guanylate cyclase domain-containing protein [Armatimonadota bacterium]
MAGPAQVATFLFTDIAGSSSTWERDPDAALAAVTAHNACVRRHVEANGGHVFKSLGDGLAAVFESPMSAVQAAVAVQADVTASLGPVVRIGAHSGPAVAHEGDYQGAAVNRAARIAAVAYPGQTLVSATTFGLAADLLGRAVEWRRIGEVRLRGHLRGEDLWQPDLAGRGTGFPAPVGTEPEHNLVALEREMVGRTREHRALSSLLTERRRRLVTVLGFGGTGKTTLANRTAWSCLDDFDEVWWTGLEICRTEAHARAAIVASVSDGAGSGQALSESFGKGETLLVLDCCDMLAGRLDAVGELLRSFPKLSILATSRNVLGLPYEHVFELGGLDLKPGAGGLSDASRLFVEAAEASVGLQPTRADRALVGGIVERLEGNPLAILLAAGRLRAMSLEELAARVLESPLGIVRSTRPGGRHESLRHVVETSMSILDDVDREWTVRLSVFEGPFQGQDAAALFGADSATEDALLRLRDSSLLTTGGGAGTLTFRQPDPVREFARESVGEPETARWREAHARHFAGIARDEAARFERGETEQATATILARLGDLRAGFAASVTDQKPDQVVPFVRCLARFAAETGENDDFEALAEAGFTAARETGDSTLELELLGLRGIVARRSGRITDARDAWSARVRAAESVGNATAECDALGDLADLALSEGDLAQARSYLREAREKSDRSEATDVQVWLTVLEGRTALAERDTEMARLCLKAISQAKVAPDQDFFRLRAVSELARGVGESALAEAAAIEMVRSAMVLRHAARAAQGLWSALAVFDTDSRTSASDDVVQALLRLPRRVDPASWKRSRDVARERSSEVPASASLTAFWASARAVVDRFDGL